MDTFGLAYRYNGGLSIMDLLENEISNGIISKISPINDGNGNLSLKLTLPNNNIRTYNLTNEEKLYLSEKLGRLEIEWENLEYRFIFNNGKIKLLKLKNKRNSKLTNDRISLI